MKILTILLFSLGCANNSFGMEPEEAPSNQNINFDKIDKRQLQEKNNMLLQKNNELLHQITQQNKIIIMQNYLTYEYLKRHIDQHRSLAFSKTEIKEKHEWGALMEKTSLDYLDPERSWKSSNKEKK